MCVHVSELYRNGTGQNDASFDDHEVRLKEIKKKKAVPLPTLCELWPPCKWLTCTTIIKA